MKEKLQTHRNLHIHLGDQEVFPTNSKNSAESFLFGRLKIELISQDAVTKKSIKTSEVSIYKYNWNVKIESLHKLT